MMTRELSIMMIQTSKRVIYEIPFFGRLMDLRRIYIKDTKLILEFRPPVSLDKPIRFN